MGWYFLSILSTVGWGFTDMFYEKDFDSDEPHASGKFMTATGIISLAAHFVLQPFSESGLPLLALLAEYKAFIVIPLCYILTVLVSVKALEKLQQSIVSPIVNTSCVFTLVFLLAFYVERGKIDSVFEVLNVWNILGTALIIAGQLFLSGKRSNERIAENGGIGEKTVVTLGAVAFPLLAAGFDACESFFDGIMMDTEIGAGMGLADFMRLYSFYAFIVCFVIWLAVSVKEKKVYNPFASSNLIKFRAALFEEVSMLLYCFALEERPLFVAVISSTYCLFSILFCRVFLKKRLDKRQYVWLLLIILGVILFGIAEIMA